MVAHRALQLGRNLVENPPMSLEQGSAACGHPGPAGRRRAARRRLPRRAARSRRLQRRRRLLRDLRLRHHRHAAAGADVRRPHRPAALLRAARTPPAAGARADGDGRRGARHAREPAGDAAHRSADRDRRLGVRRERLPLPAPDRLLRRQRDARSAPAHVDARGRGAVLPRLPGAPDPRLGVHTRARRARPPAGHRRDRRRRLGRLVRPGGQARGRLGARRARVPGVLRLLQLADPRLGVRARSARRAGGAVAREDAGALCRDRRWRRPRCDCADRVRDSRDLGRSQGRRSRRRRNLRGPARGSGRSRAGHPAARDGSRRLGRESLVQLVSLALAADRLRAGAVAGRHRGRDRRRGRLARAGVALVPLSRESDPLQPAVPGPVGPRARRRRASPCPSGPRRCSSASTTCCCEALPSRPGRRPGAMHADQTRGCNGPLDAQTLGRCVWQAEGSARTDRARRRLAGGPVHGARRARRPASRVRDVRRDAELLPVRRRQGRRNRDARRDLRALQRRHARRVGGAAAEHRAPGLAVGLLRRRPAS